MLNCAQIALDVMKRNEDRPCVTCGMAYMQHSEFGDLCPDIDGLRREYKSTYRQEMAVDETRPRIVVGVCREDDPADVDEAYGAGTYARLFPACDICGERVELKDGVCGPCLLENPDQEPTSHKDLAGNS